MSSDKSWKDEQMILNSMARRLPLFLTAVFVPVLAFCQETWTIDNTASSVTFEVSHMVVSTTTGSFKNFSGELRTQGGKLEGGKVIAEIDASSIDTGNSSRDNHLRGPDFFGVARFPKIEFQGMVKDAAENVSMAVEGTLTVKGTPRPVTLKAKITGKKEINGKTRISLRIEGELNRRDYGINGGQATVGDAVDFVLAMELVKN